MRILKGYSKTEQKELEEDKKFMRCSDLLHNITGNPAEARCSLIGEKYTKADTDERISIIKDILDFYTDNAKFAEPKKYYVHFIKNDEYSYLNVHWNDDHRVAEVADNSEFAVWKAKFTREEVIAIDPRFVPFMEEAEDNE